MPVAEADMDVLRRFRQGLDRLYGSQVERAVLFGPRAPGDARPDSDWDIAVFLHGPFDFWAEAERLGQLGDALMDETGAALNTLPFRAGGYDERTGLMSEIRREGIDL